MKMQNSKCGYLILFLLLKPVIECDGQKLKERIYTKIESIRPCFRRLNSSSVVGCSSEKDGNVGTLFYLEAEEQFNNLENDQFAPYIILIDPLIFNAKMMNRFRNSGIVSGVLLPTVKSGKWEGHYPKSGYSDDASCPDSSLEGNSAICSSNSPWNPSGSNIMWQDWNFPIFYLENSTFSESLLDCFTSHNIPLKWPACSVQMTADMFASVNSGTCLRRSELFNLSPVRVCDPLGDENINYFVSPRHQDIKQEPDKSVLVVAAKMDALSLFDQLEVGFDSPTSGIVTLLSVAKTVSTNIKSFQLR